jgi:hypothetical protein
VSFTLSTLPLSLLAIYLCYRAQWQILPVMMFMSVFQAASLLNLGGGAIGIGPGYALLLIALVKNGIFGRRLAQPRRMSTAAAIILALFALYAVASAFINPHLFEGVLYTNARVGERVPLKWEAGHLNQLFYLVINVALFFVVAGRSSMAELQRSMNWFVGGCVLASIIAIYQFICLRSGLTFPSEYLHTNLSYGTFEAYDIGRFARINSTFIEASGAALFLPAALALAAWRMVITPNWKDAVYALLILTGLFLTISTTGYLCCFFLICLSLYILFSNWKSRDGVRINKLTLSAGLCVLLVGLAFVPSVRLWTADLLDTVIFSKTQTSSYEQRSQWNEDAVQTAMDTSWMGAGWGMCRASSVLPTLLGNVGIPGVVLFTGLILQVFRPLWRSRRQQLTLKGPAMFASSVLLVALIIAGPELTNPAMWVFFAIATTTFPLSQRFRSSVRMPLEEAIGGVGITELSSYAAK